MEKLMMINVPEGKELIQKTDKDGNITFKFVDIEPVRSKSWEEFCKNHFYDRDYVHIDNFASYLSKELSNSIEYDTLKLHKEDAEGILALIQLTRLHDEWVENWEPDYYNNAQFKYTIEVIKSNIVISTKCGWYHRILQFPTETMAQEFLNCFEDLINKAKRFI